MRTWIYIAAVSLLVTAGCKSKDKGAEVADKAAETAEKVEKTAEAKADEAKAKVEEAKTAASGTKMECSVKGDERFLEVRKAGNGCELAYTKNGQEAVVASSVNGTSHCETTQEKIQGRLEEAGFTCK